MPYESTITKNILAAAKRLGCLAWKNHGTRYGKAGRVDVEILIPLPNAHPHVLFVEVKRPGEGPNDKQLEEHERLQHHGATVIVATDVATVMAAIRRVRGQD